MVQRSLSLIMLAFALLGVADGWRLQASDRGQAIFDDIGPDRYMMGLGVLLAALALTMLLQRQPAAAAAQAPANDVAASDDGSAFPANVPAYVWAILALIGYAAALPWLGYLVATLAFMIVAFRIAGTADWVRSAAFGTISTGLAYWIFVRASEVPLPTGWLSRVIG